MGLQFPELLDSSSSMRNTEDTAPESLECTPSTFGPARGEDKTPAKSGPREDKMSKLSNGESPPHSKSTNTAAKSKRGPWVRDTRIHDLAMDEPMFIAEKDDIEVILQYQFKSPGGLLLLREAMLTDNACTYRLASGVLLAEGNYPIAQHGDAFLRATILDCQWGTVGPYRDRPKKGWTQDRLTGLISDINLCSRAGQLGITEIIARRYPRPSIAEPGTKAIATTVEALIAAVYIDSGREPEVLRRVLSILLGENLQLQVPNRLLTADNKALDLMSQLDRGGSVEMRTLLQLSVTVAQQAGRKVVGMVLRKIKQIFMAVLIPRWARAVWSIWKKC